MSNKTNRLLKKKPEKNSKKAPITKNTNQINAFLILLGHIKEACLLILSGISIFCLVSLISYHPFDPGWSRTAQHLKTANIAGNIGAWCADLFLYFFGILAYLFPIMILYSCCLVLFNKKFTNTLLLWGIRIFGFIITIFSGCGLVSLLNDYKIIKISLRMPVSISGITGDVLSDYLAKHANFWGSVVILLPCILAGITAMTGISWLSLTKLMWILINKLIIIVSKQIIYMLVSIKNIIAGLIKKIVEINKSSAHHGIIFQKPGNAFINDEIEDLIDGDKDVDGFLKKSSHKPPVYRGVIKVLEKVFGVTNGNLISLLKTKNIVLPAVSAYPYALWVRSS